jgi:hypothetical protein
MKIVLTKIGIQIKSVSQNDRGEKETNLFSSPKPILMSRVFRIKKEKFFSGDCFYASIGKRPAGPEHLSYLHRSQAVLKVFSFNIISLLASINVHLKPFCHF